MTHIGSSNERPGVASKVRTHVSALRTRLSKFSYSASALRVRVTRWTVARLQGASTSWWLPWAQLVTAAVAVECTTKLHATSYSTLSCFAAAILFGFLFFRFVGALSDGVEADDDTWSKILANEVVAETAKDHDADKKPYSYDKPKRYEVVTYGLTALNNRIITEYSTVSERTGWLLVSQSFLMSAFATMANNITLCEQNRILVLNAIAFSGLGIAVLLGSGIALTHRNCERLKVHRAKMELFASAYAIPPTGVAKTHPVHFLGHLATRALPSLAVAIWATSIFLISIRVFDSKTAARVTCSDSQSSASPSEAITAKVNEEQRQLPNGENEANSASRPVEVQTLEQAADAGD